MQTLAALPGAGFYLSAGAACVLLPLAVRRWRGRLAGMLACLVAGLLAGAVNAAVQAQWRLDDALADLHQNAVARLALRVAELPDDDAGGVRFVGEQVGPARSGIPRRILVSWLAPPGAQPGLPAVAPGQVWRMALVLRRPHAPLNPDAPDGEARLFARGLRATGTVRGQPRLLEDQPWASAGVAIERARYRVRTGMRRALGAHRYAPVLIALAIGDQAGVARDDWRLFNRSGITHLVSISGMHVTSIAGLAGWLLAAAWRRARWRGIGLAERVPARIAGGAAAMGVGLAYCLLAGWGVPSRRTFFMLLVVLAAGWSRLRISAGRVLAFAAAAVVMLDPWAPMAAGFWLSFGAVAILLRVAQAPRDADAGWRQRWAAALAQATRLQLTVTLGLTPLLAFLVHQVSLGSPLANAVAIPAVTFLVTPLALLCAMFSVAPATAGVAAVAGQAGAWVFDLAMTVVAWVGNADWASFTVAAAPWPWLLWALAGMAWALQAQGWPARRLGWLCMLPLLCWRPERPEPGYWRMSAMDIGQGSAILVETATQALLFDAGPRHFGGGDAGERVIAPQLQARGIDKLDVLVLSHADLDHVGGTRSVLAAVPVARSYASFDVAAWLRRDARLWSGQRGASTAATSSRGSLPAGESSNRAPDRGASYVSPARMLRCERGDSWRVDGVTFTFLHPAAAAAALGADRNANSCVLRVAGRAHSLLLTGDIGVAQERELAALGLPPTDIVLAPHHGSAWSSGRELVAAAHAGHAIAQCGYLNRFGHPAPAVERRWLRAGAAFWRSDRDGAVTAESRADGLAVWAQRERHRRYWHGR
ncbi:DNA internalization-related competence protein ComEC/Rec2 [Achromobacter dolens]|uniref:DNA internalization-related competence protein ComEC/Rec2 n=1 Tax=Achromobacter dolens TaxID=1287738 RepID=UPI0022B8D95A|nr:DNA internalization-related competence protein ComEC/Rec2 [Achromobacter dolens]MCZ8406678.1 DNA internalization-related competence protein ComEC/Rec2 [Achromobacter dolens]